ncbi:MAG: ORF6N domain-containing protein [Gammaproteobacteria bacterium]
MPPSQRKVDPERIAGRIIVLRGLRVLLDAELARLYGVQTRTLNQAVRRNQRRFPADFLVEATTEEWASLRSQIVILDKGRGRYSKFPPLAFTEHGAIMAATVLNSPRAVEMSVYVVRAFVKLRQVLASNTEPARKLEALEKSVATLDARTRRQFEEVYQAIQALMAPRASKSRPIGFTADLGKDR